MTLSEAGKGWGGSFEWTQDR